MKSPLLLRIEPTLGPLEQDYRRYYLRTDIVQATFVLAATIGALLLTNAIDLATSGASPEALRRLWAVGSAGTVTLAVIVLLWRLPRSTVLDLSMLGWSLAVVLAVLYFRLSGAAIVTEATVAMLALGCYTVIPNRLLFRVIPALLLTAIDARVQLAEHRIAPTERYSVLLAYGFIHVLGIWSSAHLHTSRRRQFEAQLRERAARHDLEHLAHTDSLTGVLARRRFIELAEQELTRYQRYHTSFTALIADLDFFKSINDAYGHNAGDTVLRRFTELLAQERRRNDLVGRLGGEEFGLLLPGTGLTAAEEVAQRIVAAWRHTEVALDHARARLTVSIGVTEVAAGDASFSDVLRRADAALYRAKQGGRDRVEILP